MKGWFFVVATVLGGLHGTLASPVPLEGFNNKGLVGIGRFPAAAVSGAGSSIETLGGLFSGMWFDKSSWRRSTNANGGFTCTGTLYALADRGFGDGTTDYRPRLHKFEIAISPFEAVGPASQDQIRVVYRSSILLTCASAPFTGFDAGNTDRTDYPHSPPNSVGQGRGALDSEGLAPNPAGGFFVSDEYGPLIYAFNARGQLESTFSPPAAVIPKRGPFPGRTDYSALSPPESGRRDNRGFEGLTLVPGGRRIAAVLQSPLVQDSPADSYGRFTRVLQFDADARASGFGRLVSEHIYPLTAESNTSTNDFTVVSEFLALSPETFLILERDGYGLGADEPAAPKYKRIVLASTTGATDIAGTGFDLERGAPGQRALDADRLPASLQPMARRDWINLLEPAELARFGLNINVEADRNTLSEKWEGLTLVPLHDPEHPKDCLLLVGNDNDFKAPVVYHNGQVVGTNAVTVDSMLLAYRVTLPAEPPSPD